MIRLFEMFSGYGGASFSLQKARIPYECVGFSEIDKSAIETYNLNFPGRKNFGDCTKINPKEIPDFDLLTGGFPCQPFSVNTNSKVRGENHKHVNLFNDIHRVLKEKMPQYFLLENVKGIKGKKTAHIFESIKQSLIDLGYALEVVEINSKDYGTPQNRERILFIGSYGGFPNGTFEPPQTEELKLHVLDLLEKNVSRRTPKIQSMKLSKECNIKKYGDINRLDAILKNKVNKKNSNVVYEILDAPSDTVSRQSDRIYEPTYSPCLTATGSDYVFIHNDKIIVLTPRECFRLMGFFNDEIKFPNISDSRLHKLAGNGWDINTISKFLIKLIPKNTTMDTKTKATTIEQIEEIMGYPIRNDHKILLIESLLKKKDS